jgi:hypothetical protein
LIGYKSINKTLLFLIIDAIDRMNRNNGKIINQENSGIEGVDEVVGKGCDGEEGDRIGIAMLLPVCPWESTTVITAESVPVIVTLGAYNPSCAGPKVDGVMVPF